MPKKEKFVVLLYGAPYGCNGEDPWGPQTIHEANRRVRKALCPGQYAIAKDVNGLTVAKWVCSQEHGTTRVEV